MISINLIYGNQKSNLKYKKISTSVSCDCTLKIKKKSIPKIKFLKGQGHRNS